MWLSIQSNDFLGFAQKCIICTNPTLLTSSSIRCKIRSINLMGAASIMNIFQVMHCLIKARLMSGIQKDLEILALRSQLAIFQEQVINQKMTKPRVTNRFRRLWVFLSKILSCWRSALMLVKPETVLGWYSRAFTSYWRRKSQGGRPKISQATIALIKRLHKENPTLSPEKSMSGLLL